MATHTMELRGTYGGNKEAAQSRGVAATVLLIGLLHAGLLLLAAQRVTTASFPSATPSRHMAVRWLETPSQPEASESPSPQDVEPPRQLPAQPEPLPAKTEPKPAKKEHKHVLTSRKRTLPRTDHALTPTAQVQTSADQAPEPQAPASQPAAVQARRPKGGDGGQTVTPPRVDAAYLANPAPEYPPSALRAKQQGKVVLRVLVGSDGFTRKVEVERSCGYSLLDTAAVNAVRRWKFTPGRRGAVAIDDWVLVPIQFKVRS